MNLKEEENLHKNVENFDEFPDTIISLNYMPRGIFNKY